jgi:ribosomal peptide maturation radical SAM protein 1
VVAASRDVASKSNVALVSMPWAPVVEPSLGLGILKTCLMGAGISARVFHVAPDLLRWLGHETYRFIADAWGLNEFVFSGCLDPVLGEQQKAAVVDRVVAYWRFTSGQYGDVYPTAASVLDLLMAVRQDVAPKLIDTAAHRILESSPRMVGFTCLFDQTIASLALANRLKSLDPTLVILFGGYALEGPPGGTVSATFPCVDHVVIGDGEEAIVTIARRVLDGTYQRDESPLAGVSRPLRRIIRAPKTDISSSPAPDYDDWFEDLAVLEREHAVRVTTEVLPVESSRGCWWGQTKHCVFCGIDEDTLAYRYRDPDLTVKMLNGLRDRYGDVTFRFSDYIMPKAYYTDLLPRLAQQHPRFRLHSEIKANHPPERVRLLADAGFIAVQPGIESFSTPVLRSMDKGVRAIDNVSLLKSGYLEGVIIYYNILFGLPQDSVDDYEEMRRMIPRLYHLAPPVSRTEVVVTRFAPLQTTPGRFGIDPKPVHHECYDTLFSEEFLDRTRFSLDDYCYYFRRSFEYSRDQKVVYDQIVHQVDHWKKLHQQRFVELSVEPVDGLLTVRDSRFRAVTEEYTLTAEASFLYQQVSERPTNIVGVLTRAAATNSPTPARLSAALEELDEKRLIWREKDLVVGLAVPKQISDQHRESRWPQRWLSLYV